MHATKRKTLRNNPIGGVLVPTLIALLGSACGPGSGSSGESPEEALEKGACVDRGSGVTIDQYGTRIASERIDVFPQVFRWASWDYTLQGVRIISECGTDEDGPFERHRAEFTILETDRLNYIRANGVAWELVLSDGTRVPGVVNRGPDGWSDGATKLRVDFPLANTADLDGAQLAPRSTSQENCEPLLIPLEQPLETPFPLVLDFLIGRTFERYDDGVPYAATIASAILTLNTDNRGGTRAEVGQRYLELVFDDSGPFGSSDVFSVQDLKVTVDGKPIPGRAGGWTPRDVVVEHHALPFVFDLRDMDRTFTISVRTEGESWEQVEVVVPTES